VLIFGEMGVKGFYLLLYSIIALSTLSLTLHITLYVKLFYMLIYSITLTTVLISSLTMQR